MFVCLSVAGWPRFLLPERDASSKASAPWILVHCTVDVRRFTRLSCF